MSLALCQGLEHLDDPNGGSLGLLRDPFHLASLVERTAKSTRKRAALLLHRFLYA
jgi:hypothetical protein